MDRSRWKFQRAGTRCRDAGTIEIFAGYKEWKYYVQAGETPDIQILGEGGTEFSALKNAYKADFYRFWWDVGEPNFVREKIAENGRNSGLLALLKKWKNEENDKGER